MFEAWTKSEAFRAAHSRAGTTSRCIWITRSSRGLKFARRWDAARQRHDAYVQAAGVREPEVDVRCYEHDATDTFDWNKNANSWLGVKNREDLMDRTTRCPKCGKRMVPIVTISGRTDLQCISCDDPGVKWAESPLTAPEKPIELERV